MFEKIKNPKKVFVIAGIIILIIAYISIALFRPAPEVKATASDIPLPAASSATIVWPTYGQEAIGAVGYGILATNGEQKSVPIASIAKTVVALSILKEKPLKTGEQGPDITITQTDVELYKSILAQNGSVVPVKLGEKISEYQMLQALMVPSGGNIADTLVNWAFGSSSNYLTYANNLMKEMGLNNTHMADASGISPQTVSSASDLIIIGIAAMENPVLAEIVGQSEVDLPLAGLVKNYNTLIGSQNIVGIKTGNTDEAGGCFLFATKTNQNGQDVVMVGAILESSSRNKALADTNSFLAVNSNKFELATVIPKGTVVGKYKVPWGKEVNIVVKEDVKMITVGGTKMTAQTDFNPINQGAKGVEVGRVRIQSGSAEISAPVVLDGKITKPSILWRLTHL